MKLGMPQVIYLFFIAMGLGIHLIKHGEERDDGYNFFIALMNNAITIWILYLGGFFN